MKKMSNNKGFTLIELMIVVAIVGVLAAIAIPNFMRFQSKAKQSESKTNLEAIGKTAEAFRAENDTYVATWDQLGWAPSGTPRYNYFYNAVIRAGGLATCVTDPGPSVATITAFTATASGNIDTDATCDGWSYTDARVLTNVTNDVSG